MSVERLSDEQLQQWIDGLSPYGPIGLALLELQQLRAAKAADRERVHSVVFETAEHVLGSDIYVRVGNMDSERPADAISSRVADALAVPVRGLSDQDRADLEAIRDEHAMRIQQNFTKSPDIDADSKRVVALMERLLGSWVCPANSNECAIRRECTNKCGRKDQTP